MAIVQGQLPANSQHFYMLSAGAGQTMEITASSPSALTPAILGADGKTIMSAGTSLSFRSALPKTQDYILVLAFGGSATSYSLSVDIPHRISFAMGGTSDTLSGTVPVTLSQFSS